MGIILDTSVVIPAERRGDEVAVLLRRVLAVTSEQIIGLSAVGVTELLHGAYRAESTRREARRRAFLENLILAVPVYSYTLEAARIAAKVDAESKLAGTIIPFPDLLIGATALSLGFSILTANVRHFSLIPGLDVIPF